MADLHRKTKQSNSAIIPKAKASMLNQPVPLYRFGEAVSCVFLTKWLTKLGTD